jgi:hypothetical protein
MGYEGKIGKFCPIQFRVDEQGFKNKRCREDCAFFCDSFKMCVLHGINANLRKMVKEMKNK